MIVFFNYLLYFNIENYRPVFFTISWKKKMIEVLFTAFLSNTVIKYCSASLLVGNKKEMKYFVFLHADSVASSNILSRLLGFEVKGSKKYFLLCVI